MLELVLALTHRVLNVSIGSEILELVLTRVILELPHSVTPLLEVSTMDFSLVLLPLIGVKVAQALAPDVQVPLGVLLFDYPVRHQISLGAGEDEV